MLSNKTKRLKETKKRRRRKIKIIANKQKLSNMVLRVLSGLKPSWIVVSFLTRGKDLSKQRGKQKMILCRKYENSPKSWQLKQTGKKEKNNKKYV